VSPLENSLARATTGVPYRETIRFNFSCVMHMNAEDCE
jgi:hypothetical protein